MTAINLIGVKQSALMTNIFTVGKLVPLLVFALVGMFFIQPSVSILPRCPNYANFSQAVLLLIYAYVGFEAAVIPAGESKEPNARPAVRVLIALADMHRVVHHNPDRRIGTLPGSRFEDPARGRRRHIPRLVRCGIHRVGALVSILGNLNGGFLRRRAAVRDGGAERSYRRVIGRDTRAIQNAVRSIILTAVVYWS